MIFFKKLANIYKSSAVVSFWTLLSRILGFIRDIIFAVLLGAGPAADAFIIAFRLPSLFRRFFTEGTFSAAFIPLLAEHNKSFVVEKGLIFTSKITTIILFIILPLIIIAEIFMPNVVLLIAPGFADDVIRFELAVPYSRIVFPYLIFIIITSIFAAALNTNGKFWAGAAAPVILNLIMILSMLIAFADSGDKGIYLCYGVIIAGIFQMLLLAWANYKNGLAFNLSFPKVDEPVKKFLKRFFPAVLGAGATQINLLVSSIFASQIPGAISWLYYSDRVAQLPLGIIAVAIGTVLLPDLSKKIESGQKTDEYLTQERAILISIFFALPASVALIYMPNLIIKSLFGYGAFTATDVNYTATALRIYAIGLPAFMLIKILAPFFFARKDVRTPLIITAVTSTLNAFLTWYLIKSIGFIGIAYSLVITGWISAILLFVMVLLNNFYVPKIIFFHKVFLIIVASLFMLVSLIIFEIFYSNFSEVLFLNGNIIKLISMIIIGLISYLFSSYFLKLFKSLK